VLKFGGAVGETPMGHLLKMKEEAKTKGTRKSVNHEE